MRFLGVTLFRFPLKSVTAIVICFSQLLDHFSFFVVKSRIGKEVPEVFLFGMTASVMQALLQGVPHKRPQFVFCVFDGNLFTNFSVIIF